MPVNDIKRQVPNARAKSVKTRVLRRAGEGVKAVATLLQDAAGLERFRCKAAGIRSWITEMESPPCLLFGVGV